METKSQYEPLSTREAARLLGCSVWTVTQKLKAGELKGFKVSDAPNGHWHIDYEEIQRFKERKRRC